MREGVGKAEGLGEAGIESDMVDERKVGERGGRDCRDLKVRTGRMEGNDLDDFTSSLI